MLAVSNVTRSIGLCITCLRGYSLSSLILASQAGFFPGTSSRTRERRMFILGFVRRQLVFLLSADALSIDVDQWRQLRISVWLVGVAHLQRIINFPSVFVLILVMFGFIDFRAILKMTLTSLLWFWVGLFILMIWQTLTGLKSLTLISGRLALGFYFCVALNARRCRRSTVGYVCGKHYASCLESEMSVPWYLDERHCSVGRSIIVTYDVGFNASWHMHFSFRVWTWCMRL